MAHVAFPIPLTIRALLSRDPKWAVFETVPAPTFQHYNISDPARVKPLTAFPPPLQKEVSLLPDTTLLPIKLPPLTLCHVIFPLTPPITSAPRKIKPLSSQLVYLLTQKTRATFNRKRRLLYNHPFHSLIGY